MHYPSLFLLALYIECYLYLEKMQLLPWGGKITSESLRFFSPIVIWTIFEPTERNHHVLYSALLDYYKVWLQLTDQATEENDTTKVVRNREAQHRYLTWRAEKVCIFHKTHAEKVIFIDYLSLHCYLRQIRTAIRYYHLLKQLPQSIFH